MAVYIPHSIFHLALLLYVRPETFGPYYLQFLWAKSLNLFNNSSVFYTCLFDVKYPEDDLKKIETCRSITESYVRVHF